MATTVPTAFDGGAAYRHDDVLTQLEVS